MKYSAILLIALAAATGWSETAYAEDGSSRESSRWYVAAGGSVSLLDDAATVVSGLPILAGRVDTVHRMDTGLGVQAAIGRTIGDFRLEVEGGISENRSRSYTAIVPPTGRIRSNGHQDALRIMANGYVDFGEGAFRPYLGAGAGWTRVHVLATAARAPFPKEAPRRIYNSRFDGFAYQLMGGGALEVTPGLSLTGQYRWLSAGTLKGKDLGNFPATRRHAGHNIDLGVRIGL